MNVTVRIAGLGLCLLVATSGTSAAQDFTVQPEDVKGDEVDYSPYVDQHYPNRVFWGDTPHHTSNSPDAAWWGTLSARTWPTALPAVRRYGRAAVCVSS